MISHERYIKRNHTALCNGIKQNFLWIRNKVLYNFNMCQLVIELAKNVEFTFIIIDSFVKNSWKLRSVTDVMVIAKDVTMSKVLFTVPNNKTFLHYEVAWSFQVNRMSSCQIMNSCIIINYLIGFTWQYHMILAKIFMLKLCLHFPVRSMLFNTWAWLSCKHLLTIAPLLQLHPKLCVKSDHN